MNSVENLQKGGKFNHHLISLNMSESFIRVTDLQALNWKRFNEDFVLAQQFKSKRGTKPLYKTKELQFLQQKIKIHLQNNTQQNWSNKKYSPLFLKQ